jgi:hypothetical protein
MLPKRASYVFLILFFIFDAVVSYWAITKMGAHEANLLISPFVEKYPILYFVCLLFEIVGLILVVLILKHFVLKESVRKIIFTSFVVYWAFGNSSVNLAYLIGLRNTPLNNWTITSITGFSITLIYLILAKHKLSEK